MIRPSVAQCITLSKQARRVSKVFPTGHKEASSGRLPAARPMFVDRLVDWLLATAWAPKVLESRYGGDRSTGPTDGNRQGDQQTAWRGASRAPLLCRQPPAMLTVMSQRKVSGIRWPTTGGASPSRSRTLHAGGLREQLMKGEAQREKLRGCGNRAVLQPAPARISGTDMA